jgi:hypothetical protein
MTRLYIQLDPDLEVKVIAVKPEPVDSDTKQAPVLAEKPEGEAYADGKLVILEISVEDPNSVAMVKHSLLKDLVDTHPEDEVESSSKGAKHKKAKGVSPAKTDTKKKGN